MKTGTCTTPRCVRALAAALLCATGAGCSYFGLGDTSPRFVGAETMNRIDKGATGDDWVVAVLGHPTAKVRLNDGETQVWKYPYEFAERSGKRMRIMPSSEATTASRTIFVQISNGVVTDWWID